MSKTKALLSALKTSIKIKGPFSMFISLIGFPAALLPVLIANRLRDLTDELQYLMTVESAAASAALTIFGGLVGLYIAQVIITNLQQYVTGGWGLDSIKAMRHIQQTIMEHKCTVRYKYIENADGFQQKIAFANNHAGRVMAESMGSLITLLQRLLTFVTVSFAMWEISWLIVIVLYVTSIPAAVLAYFQQDENFRQRVKRIDLGVMEMHYYNLITARNAMFAALQEVRYLGLFGYLKACWRNVYNDYMNQQQTLVAKHFWYNAAADFFRSVVYLGILLIAAWSIYQNPAIGLGAFTLVFALTGQLQNVTGQLFSGIMVLAQSVPYMQEFFSLDEMEREPDVSATIESGDISFEHVDFAYPGTDKNVLNNITVHIRNGEKVAVVGENGSGKSTFISLLCGMFDPNAGRIQVSNMSPIAARSGISVVFQDFAHYDASLRDNITVSDKNRCAIDSEIIEMLKAIKISDVVEEQPNGLDELVGSFSENANNLSGGQWQKISLARASYKQDAKIIILDEPTSALDPIAEAQLYRNFAELTGDKTTILISHRLGVTAIVDRILVFKDGRIIEDGSHAELVAANGHYAQMYQAQAQWYQ